VVALEDIGGNIETATSSGTVTLAINTQPGTGTLTCDNNTLTLAAGEVDFTNCEITGTVGDYTLKATKDRDHSRDQHRDHHHDRAASQLVLSTPPGGASTD